jgi:hypothetical protein
MDQPWYKRFAERCRDKGTNRIILDRESSDPYLERFYFIPRWVTLGIARIVIHRFWKGDTDSAWHDHPWPWASYILEGGYWEHRPDKKGGVDTRKWRAPGSWAVRRATDLHYIEMDPEHKEVWTMFIMLTPGFRKWGFRSFDWKTWTFHEDYIAAKTKEAIRPELQEAVDEMCALSKSSNVIDLSKARKNKKAVK